MSELENHDGGLVLRVLASAIHENAARLSAIDGATGDGDHGVNMDKGFGRSVQVAGPGPISVPDALTALGNVLLNEVGGAMGPLYGSFFLDMAAAAGTSAITAEGFGRMLSAGIAAVRDVGGAQVGDKTLLDTLVPASAAFAAALETGATFQTALAVMADAGDAAAESTRELVARVGRASRLGERSRGSLDAGAASSAVILRALAEAMTEILNGTPVPPAAPSAGA